MLILAISFLICWTTLSSKSDLFFSNSFSFLSTMSIVYLKSFFIKQDFKLSSFSFWINLSATFWQLLKSLVSLLLIFINSSAISIFGYFSFLFNSIPLSLNLQLIELLIFFWIYLLQFLHDLNLLLNCIFHLFYLL